MTDFHETQNQAPQIDTIGWFFVALVLLITAVAAIVAYHGNSSKVANISERPAIGRSG